VLDLHRLKHGTPALHVARVVVQELVDDLDVAYCTDARGRRYTIDYRSAVSMSALKEGMELRVRALANGLVKFLVFEDER
jgi:hypothetical protein